MAASLNLHRLFHTDAGYLNRLRVRDEDRTTLSTAREQIRKALREAFADWNPAVHGADLFEDSLIKSAAPPELPAPKFRIQGSFAYHTANDCQQSPSQQIDQDDGVFLPISFITTGGLTRPIIASKAYFKFVEEALAPLSRRMGWKVNPGSRPKNTCVRIEIDDRLHIDLPLYAVQEDVFRELVETAAVNVAKSLGHDSADASDSLQFSEQVYRALQDNEISLAHRKDGWIGSDPRKLEDWFNEAVEIYGQALRRVCRAYKGLRDAHWAESDLGSICLMAAVVSAVENLGGLDQRRDDLSILSVGRELDRILASPIENPAFPGEADKYLCKGWQPEFRAEVRRVIRDACDNLDRAIHDTIHKDIAVSRARDAFGDRVPDDTSLISFVGIAEVIRQIEPTPVARQMAPRTKSG
jgi:hypothetical protein